MAAGGGATASSERELGKKEKDRALHNSLKTRSYVLAIWDYFVVIVVVFVFSLSLIS